MSSKVFLMRKVLLKDFLFYKAFKTSRKCPVSCKFFGVVISPNSTVSRCCLVASVRPWKWTKAGNREVHISPLRWRLMLLSLLPVLRSQKVQRRSFGLLGASLPVQVYTRQRSLKKRPPLPSITQTVNLHHFYHILRIIINFLKHNWHVFFSVRRGTDWGNQAGEGSEKAAWVDKTRVAQKGERFVVSKQTPQEPRWAGNTV